MKAVLYIHGKDGSPTESEHYKPLFPDCDVIGLDYQTFTPWETSEEIHNAVEKLQAKYDTIILIANSIGAFFTMCAGVDGLISKAYFISPVVDMQKLSGVELTGDWLKYVQTHPVIWNAPTHILYGSSDCLISLETIKDFTQKHNATLTVMEGGEHWFHTENQMRFLDNWIKTVR